MNERRDYDKNGYGRRPYDNDFAAHCLKCEVWKEVKTKVSWKLFILIVGGILTIVGAFLGVGATIAVNGANRMIDTSKETLSAVHRVSEQVVRIETRQEAILKDLDINYRGSDEAPNR